MLFWKKSINKKQSSFKGIHQSEHFPWKAPGWGRIPKGNPKEREEEKAVLRNAGRLGLPFLFPFYFLYIQLHRKTKEASQWT